MFAWHCIDISLAVLELAVLKGQGLMCCCVIRCMEEMGDWGKVLEVIDLETSEAAADGESASEEVVTEPDDSRLFLTTDTWNGPKYLRCMLTQSMQAVMKDLLIAHRMCCSVMVTSLLLRAQACAITCCKKDTIILCSWQNADATRCMGGCVQVVCAELPVPEQRAGPAA